VLTPSQTAGPFFSFSLCVREQSELCPPDAPAAITIAGRVLDGAGDPVPDALVEIWQADEQGSHREGFGWGRCPTDDDGGYRFVTVKPGPVRAGDGQLQAPHAELLVFARGLLRPVCTRLYFPDEEMRNAADPVLATVPDDGSRASLVAAADGPRAYRFDVRLQGAGQTAFFVQ
jgi:protocatechuate 3,4-dioxygenase alpha subunit